MENPEEQQSADSHPQASLINTFCEITLSSESEAIFYLESHNFDLDSAVSTFLETTTIITTAAANPAPSTATAAAINQSRSPSYSPPESENSESPSRSRSPSPHRSQRSTQYNLRSSRAKESSSASSGRGAGRRTGGGIRMLADLNRRSNNDESDNDPDYQPSEYYTGGEKSGMLVQDPSKANDVDEIFSDARQLGAVEDSGQHRQPSSSSKSFAGTARLLSGETLLPSSNQPEERNHNIVFWNNGFTVNDGPLRRFDDPENASFLESIRRGECPKELEPSHKRSGVQVRLMRKEENCPIPEKRRAPFHGVGRTLGSASNDVSPKPTEATSSPTSAPPMNMGVVVDQTQPTTSIQFRLADGMRVVSRFNYHHTIRDIRSFIDASRPAGPRTYQLQTVGFPPKQLTDLELTIEQSGIANSVVIQKLC